MYLSLDNKNNNLNNSFTINNTETNDIPMDKTIDVQNKNSKVNRVESLKSNIFNSVNKLNQNIKSQPVFKTLKEDKPQVITSKKFSKSNISTVFDWKNTNTEVAFKKRNSSKNKESEEMNSTTFKKRNLISEFDDKMVKNYNYETLKKTTPNENDVQKKEISMVMNERFGSNQSRMKKNVDNVSVLQNHDSVMKNIKSIILLIQSVKRIDKLKAFQLRI